jgi:hypothetical protein
LEEGGSRVLQSCFWIQSRLWRMRDFQERGKTAGCVFLLEESMGKRYGT